MHCLAPETSFSRPQEVYLQRCMMKRSTGLLKGLPQSREQCWPGRAIFTLVSKYLDGTHDSRMFLDNLHVTRLPTILLVRLEARLGRIRACSSCQFVWIHTFLKIESRLCGLTRGSILAPHYCHYCWDGSLLYPFTVRTTCRRRRRYLDRMVGGLWHLCKAQGE